jgi:hypothetical protein
MNHLKVKKFGFAFGTTAALLYLGCLLVMFAVGPVGTARFFNSLLHGLDVSGIIRMDMPFWEAIIGIIEIFILGWLSGACLAAIYNATIRTE